MMVSNATPLIYLAKAGQLGLLKRFGKVCIPEEVFTEVVVEGKRLGKKDAFLVEQAIKLGDIVVKKAKPLRLPIQLEAGETATISLAKELGALALIDESVGRAAAGLAGVEVRGTLYLLLKALERKWIGLEEFLSALDKMVLEGFRLREEVYLEAVKIALEKSKKRGK